MKDIKKEIHKLYLKLQDESDFRVGEHVKITRKAVNYESGWNNVWVKLMDRLIGKTVTISKITENGITINFEGCIWEVPYFVLEKVNVYFYHVGQKFEYRNSTKYILASVKHNEVNLFNLKSGNRWAKSITVADELKITEDEMEKLEFGFSEYFKLQE